jgi:adenylyl cyclase-associated protein
MTEHSPPMATSSGAAEQYKRTSGVLHTSVQQHAQHLPDDHALTRLIRRLEAATSRLEDIASSSVDGQTTPGKSVPGAQATTTNGVPAVPAIGVGGSQDASPSTATPVPAEAKEELPQLVEDFDALINGDLKAYHELSKAPSIDKLLGEQVGLVGKRRERAR